ncbi:YfdQ family protein [Chromobacterium sp. S0633]|uniref:DUF2303 family protein n=1 Tax=Chromobacterium sp. S0633 TaxID=2957805 RepID=UPI0020A1172E|nr:DUF2303 family protein [Chromobacterium sp. S0633]MCP1290908.1 YfdQ family protein [Chromobacterium sp. S0633]
MTQVNEIQSALDAAQKPFVETINGTPFLLQPDASGSWKNTRLEDLREAPLRKKGITNLHQLDSFIDYVNRHKQTGTQVIVDADYAANSVKFKAIVNGDSQADTGFGDHIVRFDPQTTVDWKNWTTNNGKKLDQMALATFLTNNIANIVETNPLDEQRKYPSAAEMLEFVTNLEMTSTVRYRSGTKVQNGQVQFEYVEEGNDQTKGKLQMFERFGIGVVPYAGGQGYFIEAFLRFRINRDSGQLTIWFDLHRPDQVLEAATKQTIEQLQKQITDCPIYFGAV